jgi:hypothetical protein
MNSRAESPSIPEQRVSADFVKTFIMFFFAIPVLSALAELVLVTTATTLVAKTVSDIYDEAVASKEGKPD